MEREKSEDEATAERFKQVYQQLKSELLQDPAFEYDPVSSQWLHQLLDYNVPGGKLDRGLSVVETYKLLKQDDHEPSDDNQLFLASVLGWCIQWLVASVLVLDDILNYSHTRRGQPCSSRLPKVGKFALNDGIFIWSHINRILKKHFRDKSYYVDLLDLFNEVEFQTASGEMIELVTTLDGEKDSLKYTPELQRRISLYKTSYGIFYLPFACAVLVLGEKLDDYNDEKNILLEMGIYFQAQDDYHNCFGDPEKVVRIGTDIQDTKCSWLVAKALDLCDEEQKKELCDNYGKADASSITLVESLFSDLNLQGDYFDCFGDLEKVGRIGTDIQDFKCSWLVVKALELCDEEQKKVLCDNYGKVDASSVTIVKSLYSDLNLQEVFAEYEREVYEKLTDSIEGLSSKSVQAVLMSYLAKMHKRQAAPSIGPQNLLTPRRGA